MPVPQKFARGDKMGRGPYEKSGLVADTGLHPGKKQKEHFEIFFPVEEKLVDDVVERNLLSDELNLKVELWYLPYGNKQADPFLWKEFNRTVSVSGMN